MSSVQQAAGLGTAPAEIVHGRAIDTPYLEQRALD